MIKWVRKRKRFPILERSPWLVFMAALGSLVNFALIPSCLLLSAALNYKELDPNNRLGVGDPNFTEAAKILRSIYFALEYMLYFPYFLRYNQKIEIKIFF